MAMYKEKDRYQIISEIVDFISCNNINSFRTLIEYSRLNNSTWYNYLVNDSAYLIKCIIKERRTH